MKGIFITVEGCDGAGKSTQTQFIKSYLEEKGISPVMLREPGGTAISEKLREIILDKENSDMTDMTEVLLYAASRAQLVGQVILPALKEGKVIVCDRFLDSSIAYQGFGRKINLSAVEEINKYAVLGISPDLTIYLDITPEESFKRKKLMEDLPDRIESEKKDFHERVYNGYKYAAEKFPERFFTVNAVRERELVFSDIKKRLDLIFNV